MTVDDKSYSRHMDGYRAVVDRTGARPAVRVLLYTGGGKLEERWPGVTVYTGAAGDGDDPVVDAAYFLCRTLCSLMNAGFEVGDLSPLAAALRDVIPVRPPGHTLVSILPGTPSETVWRTPDGMYLRVVEGNARGDGTADGGFTEYLHPREMGEAAGADADADP